MHNLHSIISLSCLLPLALGLSVERTENSTADAEVQLPDIPLQQQSVVPTDIAAENSTVDNEVRQLRDIPWQQQYQSPPPGVPLLLPPPNQLNQLSIGYQNDFSHLSKGGFVDFAGAQRDPETGLLCVVRNGQTDGVQKDPLLQCVHRSVRLCHQTYVTQFSPHSEEVCDENFEKICQISFKKQAFNETVKKCYRELETVCGSAQLDQQAYYYPRAGSASSVGNFGSANKEERCETFYETACTTRYEERGPGKFVGKTECEKLPRKLCGNSNCQVMEKPEICHDKKVDAVLEVPEESCDLNPQKFCRFQTRLVPRLEPVEECTFQPREVCELSFSVPKKSKKSLKVKLCLQEDTQSVHQQQQPRPILLQPRPQPLPVYRPPSGQSNAPSPIYYKP